MKTSKTKEKRASLSLFRPPFRYYSVSKLKRKQRIIYKHLKKGYNLWIHYH